MGNNEVPVIRSFCCLFTQSGLGGDFPELEPAELFCHSESPAAPPAYSRFTKKLQVLPCYSQLLLLTGDVH